MNDRRLLRSSEDAHCGQETSLSTTCKCREHCTPHHLQIPSSLQFLLALNLLWRGKRKSKTKKNKIAETTAKNQKFHTYGRRTSCLCGYAEIPTTVHQKKSRFCITSTRKNPNHKQKVSYSSKKTVLMIKTR